MILTPLQSADIGIVRGMYESSFPQWERTDFENLIAYAKRDDGHFLALYDGEVKGMAFIISDNDIVFLLYYAVREGCRGCGIGTKGLALLSAYAGGRRVFLNIEPPDDGAENIEQRRSRLSFYQKAGFVPAGRLHTAEGDFLTLCGNGIITAEELESFRKKHDFRLLFSGDSLRYTERIFQGCTMILREK